VDVAGWLEALSAHLAIGATFPSSPTAAVDSIGDCTKCSKEEQSAAMATATDSTLQVILRCVTGRFAKVFS
ncbi:hypothetical protein BHE74_00007342, partial [Ensete ventricosum]